MAAKKIIMGTGLMFPLTYPVQMVMTGRDLGINEAHMADYNFSLLRIK
ncbi:MAG: hypothetical protein V7724_16775 [Sediminicola sp.]